MENAVNISEALDYANQAGTYRAQVAVLAMALSDIGETIASAKSGYEIKREDIIGVINVALAATDHDIVDAEPESAEPPKKRSKPVDPATVGEDF